MGSWLWEAKGLTDGETELDLGPGGSMGLSWPIRIVPSWAEWPDFPMPFSVSHWMWAISEGMPLGKVKLRHGLEEMRAGGRHTVVS